MFMLCICGPVIFGLFGLVIIVCAVLLTLLDREEKDNLRVGKYIDTEGKVMYMFIVVNKDGGMCAYSSKPRATVEELERESEKIHKATLLPTVDLGRSYKVITRDTI